MTHPPSKKLAPYVPHLSLLYAGELSDAERGALVAELAAAEEGSDAAPPAGQFSCSSLSLWFTPVEDASTASWQELGAFPMLSTD